MPKKKFKAKLSAFSHMGECRKFLSAAVAISNVDIDRNFRHYNVVQVQDSTGVYKAIDLTDTGLKTCLKSDCVAIVYNKLVSLFPGKHPNEAKALARYLTLNCNQAALLGCMIGSKAQCPAREELMSTGDISNIALPLEQKINIGNDGAVEFNLYSTSKFAKNGADIPKAYMAYNVKVKIKYKEGSNPPWDVEFDSPSCEVEFGNGISKKSQKAGMEIAMNESKEGSDTPIAYGYTKTDIEVMLDAECQRLANAQLQLQAIGPEITQEQQNQVEQQQVPKKEVENIGQPQALIVEQSQLQAVYLEIKHEQQQTQNNNTDQLTDAGRQELEVTAQLQKWNDSFNNSPPFITSKKLYEQQNKAESASSVDCRGNQDIWKPGYKKLADSFKGYERHYPWNVLNITNRISAEHYDVSKNLTNDDTGKDNKGKILQELLVKLNKHSDGELVDLVGKIKKKEPTGDLEIDQLAALINVQRGIFKSKDTKTFKQFLEIVGPETKTTKEYKTVIEEKLNELCKKASGQAVVPE